MITIDIQCIVCNEIHFIQVREDDYQRWESGELVQRAFPYLNAADREMFISGVCGVCFDKMFAEI